MCSPEINYVFLAHLGIKTSFETNGQENFNEIVYFFLSINICTGPRNEENESTQIAARDAWLARRAGKDNASTPTSENST